MPSMFRRAIAFLTANKKLWLPQVLVTLVLFLAVIFFTQGKTLMPFVYRLF